MNKLNFPFIFIFFVSDVHYHKMDIQEILKKQEESKQNQLKVGILFINLSH